MTSNPATTARSCSPNELATWPRVLVPHMAQVGHSLRIFAVQVSMNFNTSVYPNAVTGVAEKYGVSEPAARVGQMIFLVAYAFGCEFWAPWSEEIGRWPVLQISLFLVNIWQVLAALAPNYGSLIVARFLGGLFTAGGSVTLGMVADMWEPDEQQFAVAFVVLSSSAVPRSVLSLEASSRLISRWSGTSGFSSSLVVLSSSSTLCSFPRQGRRSCLTARRSAAARMARRTFTAPRGPHGPFQHARDRKVLAATFRDVRPRADRTLPLAAFRFLGHAHLHLPRVVPARVQAVGLQHVQVGLAFIPINLGYLLGYLIFIPRFIWERKRRVRDPDALKPEARLWLLLYLVPLETLGLFGFAWTSLGPPRVHWIAPMIFSTMIAIANYSIYMSTIDYMIAAYGPYSASATGGNALARDFLAGVSAMYATPLYNRLGLEWGKHAACLPRHHRRHPRLRLLRQGSPDPRALQVRPVACRRQEGERWKAHGSRREGRTRRDVQEQKQVKVLAGSKAEHIAQLLVGTERARRHRLEYVFDVLCVDPWLPVSLSDIIPVNHVKNEPFTLIPFNRM